MAIWDGIKRNVYKREWKSIWHNINVIRRQIKISWTKHIHIHMHTHTHTRIQYSTIHIEHWTLNTASTEVTEHEMKAMQATMKRALGFAYPLSMELYIELESYEWKWNSVSFNGGWNNIYTHSTHNHIHIHIRIHILQHHFYIYECERNAVFIHAPWRTKITLERKISWLIFVDLFIFVGWLFDSVFTRIHLWMCAIPRMWLNI